MRDGALTLNRRGAGQPSRALLSIVLLGLLLVPVPTSTAKDSQGPIEHLVIIVRENHSFDNYFGSFSGANSLRKAAADGLTSAFTFSSSSGDHSFSWRHFF
ncbi:MAG: hypothetical protein E6K86_01330 [Thaumarchaeota archaeon]|nr:MAG: hypothetical protein E6K86_01330 [Nitrososphaerota archaeon]